MFTIKKSLSCKNIEFSRRILAAFSFGFPFLLWELLQGGWGGQAILLGCVDGVFNPHFLLFFLTSTISNCSHVVEERVLNL